MIVFIMMVVVTFLTLSSSQSSSSSSSPSMYVNASAPTVVSNDVDGVDDTAKEGEDYETKSTSSTNNKIITNINQYRFVHKTIIIPHDDKKFRGGEDSASTSNHMLIVADGVGGWASKGINPGLYSSLLTKTILNKFLATLSSKIHMTIDDPKHNNKNYLTELVHESNHEAADKHLGSATCTVLRLLNSNLLETLNVGDSGYSIHRRVTSENKQEDGSSTSSSSSSSSSSGLLLNDSLEVVYASIPGQKGFNYPYQLGGKYGDIVAKVADGPRTHELNDKDIIIVVSDGVSDNIQPYQYHDCINEWTWSTSNLDKYPNIDLFNKQYEGYYEENELISYSIVADCIARKAYRLGKDKSYDSPFAQSAKSYGKRYVGGKHDDITVTVAQIEKAIYNKNTMEYEFSMNIDQDDDPHYKESIKIYKDSDGDIGLASELPKQSTILHTLLFEVNSANGANGENIEKKSGDGGEL
jgi:protein phosphatase PTC7